MADSRTRVKFMQEMPIVSCSARIHTLITHSPDNGDISKKHWNQLKELLMATDGKITK